MTRDTIEKIINTLKKQGKEEGKLPLLLEFYSDLLNVQAEAFERIGVLQPTITTRAIMNRLTQGKPLVTFDEMRLDWTLLRQVFIRVIKVFDKYPGLFGEIPAQLKRNGDGRLLTKKAVKAWLAGKALPPRLNEDTSGELVQAIIQATLYPFLAAHAEPLRGSIRPEHWHQGYCPVCGGSPDIAYLEKEVGARRLVCSRCDTEWQFHRMVCPYCRTQDQHSLSFLSDERDLYRLYLCGECRCYLKAIDLRKTDAGVLMPLERIYTLDLDKQAKELGYRSCRSQVAGAE